MVLRFEPRNGFLPFFGVRLNTTEELEGYCIRERRFLGIIPR